MSCDCKHVLVTALITGYQGSVEICGYLGTGPDGTTATIPYVWWQKRVFNAEDGESGTKFISDIGETFGIHDITETGFYNCGTPDSSTESGGSNDNTYSYEGSSVTAESAISAAMAAMVPDGFGETEASGITQYSGEDWGMQLNWYLLREGTADPTIEFSASVGSGSSDVVSANKQSVRFRRIHSKVPVRINYSIQHYDDVGLGDPSGPPDTGEITILSSDEYSDPIEVFVDRTSYPDALTAVMTITLDVPAFPTS